METRPTLSRDIFHFNVITLVKSDEQVFSSPVDFKRRLLFSSHVLPCFRDDGRCICHISSRIKVPNLCLKPSPQHIDSPLMCQCHAFRTSTYLYFIPHVWTGGRNFLNFVWVAKMYEFLLSYFRDADSRDLNVDFGVYI